eukprot:1188335-Prorocentrum_minimum.AAC.3
MCIRDSPSAPLAPAGGQRTRLQCRSSTKRPWWGLPSRGRTSPCCCPLLRGWCTETPPLPSACPSPRSGGCAPSNPPARRHLAASPGYRSVLFSAGTQERSQSSSRRSTEATVQRSSGGRALGSLRARCATAI